MTAVPSPLTWDVYVTAEDASPIQRQKLFW
jgi:hypothetical protein